MLLFYLPFLIFLFLFLYVYHKEPRTVICGILLVITGVLLFLALLMTLLALDRVYGVFPGAALVRVIITIVMTIIAIWPTLMILLTLYAGLRALIQGGMHWHNTFALFFSAVLVIYTLIWPWIGTFHINQLSTWIYSYITGIVSYTILSKTMLTLTSEINLRHRKLNHGLNYIVVMGSPLIRPDVTRMVMSRADKAIELHRNNPGSKLVVSGDWAAKDTPPAYQALADYLWAKGISKRDILLEKEGLETNSMVANAYALIQEDLRHHKNVSRPPKIAFVSSSYHVMRTLTAARTQKIPCIGFGVRPRLHVGINAFIREYLLYMKLTRKLQLTLLAIYTVVFWSISLIVYFRH